MDIRQFRYFVTVAETLSFAKAAQALNISPPSLSVRIAELEKELGIKLFNRTTKKVKLTSAGEAFLPQACDVVRTFTAAVRGARSLSKSQSRSLRIAYSPTTSRDVLSDIISLLQREQVKVHLFDASTAEQQQFLAAGTIDIGVLRYPFDNGSLQVSAPLGLPMGIMIDAKHPLAKADKLHLRDLSPYPLSLFPRDFHPACHDELLNLCRAGGYVPPRVVHSTRTILAVLRGESAVALVSKQDFKRLPEAEAKEGIWRPLEGPPIHYWTSVVCRSEAYVEVTRTAVDMISTFLQRHDGWVPLARPITDRRIRAS